MNSVQLAQRLARNLAVTDPFDLPADAALDVLAAINSGLATFYREVPGIYKRTTLSHTVRSPLSLTVAFRAQYSNLVASDTFGRSAIGCTIRFGNGSADNVVTGSSSLLDDYLGTDLAQAATIYYDAIPIQDVIERIIGHVRLYDKTQSAPTILTRDERLRGGLARIATLLGNWDDSPLDGIGVLTAAIGRPRFYYLEPMGVSQGAEPEFILRLAPMPDIDYTVRLEAELSTQRIVFADLATPRQINVGEAYLDDILVPLCEAELVTSSFWRDKNIVAAITARQEKILQSKLVKIPSDVAPASNRIGTPPGF